MYSYSKSLTRAIIGESYDYTNNVYINCVYRKILASIYTREMGGRICNDGYPDARFKCTYGMRWNPIRHFLSKQRQRHSSMMNRMHIVQVCCCKYKAVGPEVAKSHIGKIRDMFGWSK